MRAIIRESIDLLNTKDISGKFKKEYRAETSQGMFLTFFESLHQSKLDSSVIISRYY